RPPSVSAFRKARSRSTSRKGSRPCCGYGAMTDENDHPDTAEIAARWVARLDRGDLSADELIALREWAIAHPSHMRELEYAVRIWESLDALAALRTIVARPERSRRKTTMPRAVAAGVAALAAALSLLLWIGVGEPA